MRMGGQKFEYDESGSTFFYFVLSFLALILVPATFYYWPRKRKEGKSQIMFSYTFYVLKLYAAMSTLKFNLYELYLTHK